MKGGCRIDHRLEIGRPMMRPVSSEPLVTSSENAPTSVATTGTRSPLLRARQAEPSQRCGRDEEIEGRRVPVGIFVCSPTNRIRSARPLGDAFLQFRLEGEVRAGGPPATIAPQPGRQAGGRSCCRRRGRSLLMSYAPKHSYNFFAGSRPSAFFASSCRRGWLESRLVSIRAG